MRLKTDNKGGIMQRRDVLAMGGIAALMAGSKALAQSGQAQVQARLIRVYATPDGKSHIEDLVIAPDAGPVPISRMTAGVYGGSGTRSPDWHNAPRKQFAINMTGALEVEITDGTRRKIGAGDLVFLEDTTGQGHVTRPLGPITNLFLHVPDDFDVVAWSRGAG
jgi:quercetin dioxygenase-like cupin family protein